MWFRPCAAGFRKEKVLHLPRVPEAALNQTHGRRRAMDLHRCGGRLNRLPRLQPPPEVVTLCWARKIVFTGSTDASLS